MRNTKAEEHILCKWLEEKAELEGSFPNSLQWQDCVFTKEQSEVATAPKDSASTLPLTTALIIGDLHRWKTHSHTHNHTHREGRIVPCSSGVRGPAGTRKHMHTDR